MIIFLSISLKIAFGDFKIWYLSHKDGLLSTYIEWLGWENI